MDEPILQARAVSRSFASRRHGEREVLAVDGVDLAVPADTVASIVGESGSGKTTLARMLLGLLRPTGGSVLYRGQDLARVDARQKRAFWRNVQGVFQDPYSSFNQFFRVRKVLGDAFRLLDGGLSRAERQERIERVLEAVNLKADDVLDRYPFELSGGQAQRLMIARAFLINPAVLIADEPTSMIDACSRLSILEALLALRREHGTSVLFVTHDMGMAYRVSDVIHIMHRGRIVESGPAAQVMESPQHPYTQGLLADVPRLHGQWL
jgi:peptide/nickel transport system ATP-binding protein